MSSIKITEDVYSVGVLNPSMRVFDIIMTTDYGTSYNAYLVRGSEKTALIDTCHKSFFKHFVENVEEVCPLSEIDYVILNHNEPDHSGGLAALLEINPNITVIASQAGSIYLKNITNRTDLRVQVAKDGDTISLGNKTLRFMSAPFLHWPDSMFTWVEEDRCLFSCDFFGAHYCEPYVFDYNITYPDKYRSAYRAYYDAIFGPFKPYVLKGLEKVEGLSIDFICNSHGPILTKDGLIGEARELYRQWSQPHQNPVKTVPVFYTSAYGNTKLVACAIREGILSAIPDAEVKLYDIIEHDLHMLSGELDAADAFAIGTPTINKDAVPPTWMLLSHVDAINNQKKPALVFGSYGWSGEGVPNVISRLQGLKMKVFGEGLKVCFVPSAEELAEAASLGRAFAESL